MVGATKVMPAGGDQRGPQPRRLPRRGNARPEQRGQGNGERGGGDEHRVADRRDVVLEGLRQGARENHSDDRQDGQREHGRLAMLRRPGDHSRCDPAEDD